MTNHILKIGLVALTLACSNTKEEAKTVDVPALESTPSAIEAASAGTLGMPTTYTTEAKKGRINPPHGEPGHLCEYEVGAWIPEDVVASTPTVTVPTGPERPTPIQPGIGSPLNTRLNTMVPTGPKPKYNPPHGEPWHDCAIEVGAPLT